MFEQARHLHFASLNSTNNFASTIAKLTETQSGTAITTDFQTEGRGQRDNLWLAPPNSSFLGSVIIKRGIQPENIFFLSKWSALQVAKALLKQEIEHVSVKWPNDIFVEGKKIGGILIENSWSDHRLHYSIIGIGINLSASPIENATNFAEHSDKVPSTDAFLQTLRQQMDSDYFLLEENNFKELDKQYHDLLFQRDTIKDYRISRDASILRGKIIRVEDDGKLIIEREDLSLSGFYMKEIVFL